MHFRIFALATVLLFGIFVTSQARADCTDPAGVEGDVKYNGTYKTAMFCDGTNWWSMKGGAPLVLDQLTNVDTTGVSDGQCLVYNTTSSKWEDGTCTGGGGGDMNGMIAAFEDTACPTGWTEYLPARGRFLRGIDNGAGNDPDGTRAPGNAQADDFKSHTHMGGNVGLGVNPGGAGGGYAFSPANVATTPTGGAETRPKNVAVIFCEYAGGGGGGGGGGATLLDELSDVDAASPTDGQVLTYNNSTSNWQPADPGAVSGAVPSGAVMTFDLTSCPIGWSEYTPAKGRFVRGVCLDSTGCNDPAGVRAVGSTQADEFKSHTHSELGQVGAFNNHSWSGTGSLSGTPTGATGGPETRPVNVALLYCKKN